MNRPALHTGESVSSRRPTKKGRAFSSTLSGTITGLLTGLGWGLGFGFFDGQALLWARWPYPEGSLRLQALAYGMAWYGLTLALIGGVLGLITALGLLLRRRPADRVRQVAIGSGLAAFFMVGLSWVHRFNLLQDRKGGFFAWIVLAILAVLAGLVAGWTIYGLGRRGWPGRRGKTVLQWTILCVFFLVVLAPLSRGLYRAFWEGRGAFAPSGLPATPEHPNIVLITVDSLRADHLGVYGYDQETSPYLDGLAGRGITFEAAVAPSSWSRPSVASLMTSLYPSELQITCRPWHRCTVAVDPLRTTMAESLQSIGYHTGAYLDNPWLAVDESLEQGFEQFAGVRPRTPYDLKQIEQRQSLVAIACTTVQPWCDLFRKGYHQLFDSPLIADYSGDVQNQLAQRFLERNHQVRFFLWLHDADTHIPHNPAKPFWPIPEGSGRVKGLDMWHLGYRSERQLNPGDDLALQSFYDQEIARTDFLLIGRTLATLDRLELTDRTIIVVTADHGEAFGEHGEFTYGHTLYEELIHVPLIVAGPAVTTPGARVSTPVSLVDLLPTIAEIAGAEIPAHARGKSLLPALQGETLQVRPVYAEGLYRLAEEWKMIRQGENKLIYHLEDGTVELYHLGSDPNEQENLAGEQEAVVTNLLEMLQQWMNSCSQSASLLPRSVPPADLDYERRNFIHNLGF